MIKYEKFEATILAEGGEHAKTWKHLLPAIPLAHRLRFLFTVRKGFNIPASFDMIMLSQTLGEAAYEEFVQQAIAKRLSDKEPDNDHVNKVRH